MASRITRGAKESRQPWIQRVNFGIMSELVAIRSPFELPRPVVRFPQDVYDKMARFSLLHVTILFGNTSREVFLSKTPHVVVTAKI